MFVLSKDIDKLGFEESTKKIGEYKKYLASIKDKLSLSPTGFIFESWYTDFSSHKCPHDSWLDELVVSEDDENNVSISLRLLGAYHDGFITLKYTDVQYYRLDRNKSSVVKASHGDLRCAEFRLDEDGNIIHEFDWYTLDENAVFLIACKHIGYEWEEIDQNTEIKRRPEWKTN